MSCRKMWRLCCRSSWWTYSRKKVPRVGLTSKPVTAVHAGFRKVQFPNSSIWKMISLMFSTTERYLTSLASRACSERLRSMHKAMPLATDPISWLICSVSGCRVKIGHQPDELVFQDQRIRGIGGQACAFDPLLVGDALFVEQLVDQDGFPSGQRANLQPDCRQAAQGARWLPRPRRRRREVQKPLCAGRRSRSAPGPHSDTAPWPWRSVRGFHPGNRGASTPGRSRRRTRPGAPVRRRPARPRVCAGRRSG